MLAFSALAVDVGQDGAIKKNTSYASFVASLVRPDYSISGEDTQLS